MTEKDESKLTPTRDEQQPTPEVVERVAERVAPLLRDRSQTRNVVRVVMQEVSEQYQGPLPHPEHLRRFEEISPGAASRLINMAEREQAHRHSLQQLEINYPYLGLASGLIIALAAIGGSIYLATLGATTVALTLIGVPIVGCIGWFVKARVSLSEPPPPPAKPVGRGRRR